MTRFDQSRFTPSRLQRRIWQLLLTNQNQARNKNDPLCELFNIINQKCIAPPSQLPFSYAKTHLFCSSLKKKKKSQNVNETTMGTVAWTEFSWWFPFFGVCDFSRTMCPTTPNTKNKPVILLSYGLPRRYSQTSFRPKNILRNFFSSPIGTFEIEMKKTQ